MTHCNPRTRKARHAFAPLACATLIACLTAGAAQAFEINSGIPDLSVRLDTTVRYNYGMRAGERDTRLITSNATDEGNWLFSKDDTVLSRFDLLSELDVNYKNQFGARLSAAGWYDTNFPSRPVQDPRFAPNSNYANGEFSNYIRRYYRGPSGEFQDAFVWGQFELGRTRLDLKAGRLAWLPGEFLMGNGSSVSFSMAPNDGRKSDLSPGASAKETVLPIGQVTASWQINNQFTLLGAVTAEFRSARISEGGTFWSVADVALNGPQYISNPAVPRGAAREGKAGDVTLGLKWSPESLNGDSIGFWLRKFDDKNPTWMNQTEVLSSTSRIGRAVYARNIELIGLTYNTSLAGWGTGVELNYRRKMPLALASGVSYGALGAQGMVNDPDFQGPRGDTLHFLISGAKTLNKNALFDSGSVALQLDANYLSKVTTNAGLFNGNFGGGKVAACADNTVLRNCATRFAASLGVNVSATWQQALPSTDISMPITFIYGLTGNSGIVNAGTMPEGSWLFRPGIRAEYFAGQYKHQFDLSYTMRGGKTGYLPGSTNLSASGLANFRDRNYLSFTYSTNF